MCVTVQIDPLKFIFDTCTALSPSIRYLQDPQLIITKLSDAIDQLRSKRDDIQIRVRLAEFAGEKASHQIQNWFDKVINIDGKVSKIITDHQNGSFRCCINCRAADRLADVTALTEKIMFDAFTIKLPPIGMKEIHGESLIATNSVVKNLLKLRELIQEDTSRVIGIWGMGGVGKTTLLCALNNELFRSSEAGQSNPMFDHVIWAVVSKEYKPLRLLRDIANWLELKLSDDEHQHANEINKFLQNKSFLLLLDDLWNLVKLEDLGIPSPHRNGGTKKVVVFTTRNESVCVDMQAQHKIRITCLTETEALQFFKDKVHRDALRAHRMIPQLAEEVAKLCDGLPLALTVIGSTMSSKKTTREWRNAITQLEKRPHEILPINDKLRFSYDMLADEIIKKCFLLCSLFPECHSISKNDLIECWMGHGLVDERKFDNINEAYDYGYDLIGKLQAACLLEPGDNKDREVKMHELVRGLALWIASDCGVNPNRFVVLRNFNASVNPLTEVERISLVRSDLSDTSFLPANCSRLETLMAQNSESFKPIMSRFFEETRALTYLDLSYTAIDDLPKEIGLVGNLRYLNLSHTKIPSLPQELGDLRELRFLLLRELESISIPCGVLEKLVLLSVIDMTNTWCNNWRELLKLRGSLKGVGILLESIEDLHKLAQRPNVLTWRLGLRKLLGFKEPLQLLSPLLLGSRSIIQMLKIEFCESLEVVSMESDGNGAIERLEELELKSLPELKEVVFQGVRPKDMLPSLTVLTISACHKLSNISWVIQLPSLEDLTVHHCNQMQQIIDDNNEFAHCGEEGNGVGMADWAFLSLRKLSLWHLNSLRVFGGPFTFPSLELLYVNNCPKMKMLPFGAEMVGKKLKEIRGAKKWWDELSMEDSARAALLPYFKLF